MWGIEDWAVFRHFGAGIVRAGLATRSTRTVRALYPCSSRPLQFVVRTVRNRP